MKEKFSQEVVQQLAKLSKLSVSNAEALNLGAELNSITEHFDLLREFNEAHSSMEVQEQSLAPRLRKDKAEQVIDPEKLRKNLPARSGNFIEVPLVIADSGDGS